MSDRSAHGFRHLEDRAVHHGHVWDMVVATFEAPDGSVFERDIVRSPGAVAAVALLADTDVPTVALVAQYRPTFDEIVVEIPAGMRDVDDEPLETTARRELAEEVGLRPGSVQRLTEIYPNVGVTDSVTTIFLATECTPVDRRPQGPEEDAAEVITIPLEEAVAWVEAGRIVDGKSVAGLLLAARRQR